MFIAYHYMFAYMQSLNQPMYHLTYKQSIPVEQVVHFLAQIASRISNIKNGSKINR